MRTYTFSGIPYIGNGELSFGIPSSNQLCLDYDPINTKFVDFLPFRSGLFAKVVVTALNLRAALHLLRHALMLNNLDLLLDVSYHCVTENGKGSSRILRSV